MRTFFLSLLMLSRICIAHTASLTSETASYHDNTLILEGSVLIDHSLGMMKAGCAKLKKAHEGKQTAGISEIELISSIEMKLANQSLIFCERALFDFCSFKAHLTSPSQIHYIDHHSREGKKIPFEFFTKQVDLHFHPISSLSSHYQIDFAQASHQVHLIYDDAYHLHTESLLFKDNHLASSSQRCIWNHLEDELTALGFDLDLDQEELKLHQAEGVLHTLSHDKLLLKTDLLHWKHQENILLLQGVCSLESPHLGTLFSSSEMKLTFKNHLPADLYTTGTITVTTPSKDLLISHGPLHVNHLNHTLTAAPSSCRRPLFYEGDLLLIEAEQGTLAYEEKGKLFSPHQLQLEGNVKILSKDAQIQAIAGSISYNPSTRNCLLKAAPGGKVLILQESKGLKMSSDEIHMIYDPFEKDYSIQGIGCVCLSLSADEQQLFNQVFHDQKHTSSS
ncbi:MAG: hypothetical protein QRY72_03405 [Candidatus Rhabdochlamydia sp.]